MITLLASLVFLAPTGSSSTPLESSLCYVAAVSQGVGGDGGGAQRGSGGNGGDGPQSGGGTPEETEDYATATTTVDDVMDAWLGTGHGEIWSPHRLNYAAVGPDDLKMQISFKYRAVRDVDFYVAFTSIIVWDIWEDSLPYRDISFNPEFFYRVEGTGGALLAVDTGYWHTSNGKDGGESRAWDRLFVRGNFATDVAERQLIISPSIYVTLYESDKNGDISDYLGDWDLRCAWRSLIDPKADDLDLLMTLVAGEDNIPFKRGSFELAARYRLQNVTFNPRLLLQFFTGYGNTILEYDESETTIRFGLAF